MGFKFGVKGFAGEVAVDARAIPNRKPLYALLEARVSLAFLPVAAFPCRKFRQSFPTALLLTTHIDTRTDVYR